MDNTIRLNFKKYDLMYLWSLHDRYSTETGEPVIVTGLSYGLDGFEPKVLPGSYNFCMHTQDIFYDYCHVKKILENKNAHPKVCIMCWGYYSLFRDLSKSPDYLWRAYAVYKPLFGTIHNAPPITEEYGLTDDEKMEAKIFFGKTDYSYYNNPFFYRPFSATPGIKAKNIVEATLEERIEMARYTAGKHNKMIKYVDTFMENTRTFTEAAKALISADCKVCICIMPYMREYFNFINMDLKAGMLDFLDRCSFPVDFIDLNDAPIWELEDYLDICHLNASGAAKATAYLKDALNL